DALATALDVARQYSSKRGQGRCSVFEQDAPGRILIRYTRTATKARARAVRYRYEGRRRRGAPKNVGRFPTPAGPCLPRAREEDGPVHSQGGGQVKRRPRQSPLPI